MPDHVLNVFTVCNWVLRAATVGATSVASSAYHLLESVRLFDVSVYPALSVFSHRMSGSTIRRNRSGDRGSPCKVPRRT